MSKSVLPMYSSRSFMVLCHTFRSLNNFGFIFVYGVMECSSFINLHVVLQLSQHHLLKRQSLLHCVVFVPRHRSVDSISLVPFLGSLLCSIHPFVYCSINTTLLDYYSFIVSPDSGSTSLQLCSSSTLSWQCWVFHFCT